MGAIRRHVWVSGRVQGVWFRGATEAEAARRGLAGWVRNLPDGRVEAVFEGDAEAVSELLEFVQQGPRHAEVRSVQVREESPEGEQGFRIRH